MSSLSTYDIAQMVVRTTFFTLLGWLAWLGAELLTRANGWACIP